MKQLNRNKDSFLKLYRDFLSSVNASDILLRKKKKNHFISPSKQKKEEQKRAKENAIKALKKKNKNITKMKKKIKF
ncbi:hypothetical protein AB836_02105 [Rickettsiales bacterium (ex Bugula neritina AB1)]|nr:hypothetical protein AB836_02105 [Rickettsiales bacterium (ex Bugula neritina AB1)]